MLQIRVLSDSIVFSVPSLICLPADDCQQMFLHPVNVRCLLREYGSLEACPDSITAAVEIRRRHRYLAHLPLTCEFSICELALQPPILSKETLDTFADKLLAAPAADSDGESDGSDRVPVPSFQNSFSQAFEKALLQLDHGAASPQPPAIQNFPVHSLLRFQSNPECSI
ncbi:hypothetical protein XENOCAPTIV_012511 [Xenoophorus captivus]|uniref:Uncharacterized protein n=1 Tax=Xenoophorus captivus TaxID=1517983 RepID=A0ABV0S3T2_9TELE